MPYVLLLIAIAVEVAASLALKASAGFTRVGFTTFSVMGFALSLWLLARVSIVLPISVTYPTWAGLGVIGATVGGVWLFGERVSGQQVLALALILGGAVLLHAPSIAGDASASR